MRRKERERQKKLWEERYKEGKPLLDNLNRQKEARAKALELEKYRNQQYEKDLKEHDERKFQAYKKLAELEINYERILEAIVKTLPVFIILLLYLVNPSVFNIAFVIIAIVLFFRFKKEYKNYGASISSVEEDKQTSDEWKEGFGDWMAFWDENLFKYKLDWKDLIIKLTFLPSVVILILYCGYNIFPKIPSYTQVFAWMGFLGIILTGFKNVGLFFIAIFISLWKAIDNIDNFDIKKIFSFLNKPDHNYNYTNVFYLIAGIILYPIWLLLKLIGKILFLSMVCYWGTWFAFYSGYKAVKKIKHQEDEDCITPKTYQYKEYSRLIGIILLALSIAYGLGGFSQFTFRTYAEAYKDLIHFCMYTLPFITAFISASVYLAIIIPRIGELQRMKEPIKEAKEAFEKISKKVIKQPEPIKIPQVKAALPIEIPAEWEEYKRKEYNKGIYGSARFADEDDLEDHGLLIHSPNPPNDLFLAKLDKFYGHQEWISIDAKKGHLLTIAPSGKGKGVHTVIPNLLTYNGSVVCLDIKGENACITGRTRASLGNIFTLNPWKIPNIPNTKFNPMDMLKGKSQEYQTDIADILSRKIVYSIKGDEDHWITSARSLVKAMILYVANAEKFEGERHLPRVLDVLSENQSGLNDTFLDMQSYININPVIGRQGSAMLGRSDSDRSGIISTAVEQLDFLNDLQLSDSMKETSNNFNILDLKQQITSIYLSIPPNKLSTGHKWLRIIIGCLFFELTSSHTSKLKKPVLFLLDEFPALGYMSEIKEAYAIMRGYNVCFWAIIQDLSQLKSTYGEAYETFIANANVLQIFGTQDYITAKYISDISGETTVEYLSYTKTAGFSDTEGSGKSKSISYSTSYSENESETSSSSFTSGGSPHGGGSSSTSNSVSSTKGSSRSNSSSNTDSTNESHTKSASEGITKNLQKRQLLVIDDILRMDRDRQILRIGEMPVCISPKLAYFKDDHFRHLADRHPSFNH